MNEAPKKKRRFWSRLVPNSLAGQVATATAVILLIAVFVVWIARIVGPNNVVILHAVGPWRWVWEVSLAGVIIPVLVYGVLRPTAKPRAGQFPDIDKAWDLGRSALDGLGHRLSDLPVFLVLGSGDSRLERALMAATTLSFKVDGVPHGENVHFSLHWYVTSDAIYLFATTVGSTSNLAGQWKNGPRVEQVTQPRSQATLRQPDPAAAGIDDDMEESQLHLQLQPQGRAPQTLSRDDLARVERAAEPQEPASPVLPQGTPSEPSSTGTAERRADVDTSLHSQRLRYLCHLLRDERLPRCGINGIVTLLPFQISTAGERSLTTLAESIRQDVRTIQETLRVRAPVTAVVTGLDRQVGFSEFVDRLSESELDRRLGGRFQLQTLPTPRDLNDHSDRLCDAFEDWIYDLFRGSDALAKQRGNRKLYSMLSRIRHQLRPQLRRVLGMAFQHQSKSGATDEDALLYSGCYFASVGAEGGPAAFVKDIFGDKLLREQARVQWDQQVLRRQAFLRIAGLVGWSVTALLCVGLVIQLALRSLGG